MIIIHAPVKTNIVNVLNLNHFDSYDGLSDTSQSLSKRFEEYSVTVLLININIFT